MARPTVHIVARTEDAVETDATPRVVARKLIAQTSVDQPRRSWQCCRFCRGIWRRLRRHFAGQRQGDLETLIHGQWLLLVAFSRVTCICDCIKMNATAWKICFVDDVSSDARANTARLDWLCSQALWRNPPGRVHRGRVRTTAVQRVKLKHHQRPTT
jgi:hypothetical protein